MILNVTPYSLVTPSPPLALALPPPSGGRTSRLVSSLVLSGRALAASVVSGYPGERRPGLALVYGIPKDGERRRGGGEEGMRQGCWHHSQPETREGRGEGAGEP